MRNNNAQKGITLDETVRDICEWIHQQGGRGYLVGGCVRDRMLGIEPKDIDIEVYHIPKNRLEYLLAALGTVQEVGKSFGVWKFKLNGYDFDVSLPRRDHKIGDGHDGFDVVLDPNMDRMEACMRRDFTINAMMLDPITGRLHDYYDGAKHLKEKRLQIVSDRHFHEDPLRPLRGMQFSGRYDLRMGSQREADIMRRMFEEGEWQHLPKERLWEEWRKWAVKSVKPGVGLMYLHEICYLRMFPEINDLVKVSQDREWHPEGTAFMHTVHCVDKMVEIADREGVTGDDRAVLVFAALCHDFGKVTTTKFEDGRIRSRGHAEAGETPTVSFLKRIGAPQWLIDRVVPLVKNHMTQWHDEMSDKAVRRLARRLEPSTITELWAVVQADYGARPPHPPTDPFSGLAEIALRLEVMDSAPKRILMGRHLLDMGFKQGPLMGNVLATAFEAQLDGGFHDLDGAITWIKDRIKSGEIDGQQGKDV